MSGYKHECYLCMVSTMVGGYPTFHHYSLYSSAPWNMGTTETINSALLRTEGNSYQEAQDRMLDQVKYLATLMPFWRGVWVWINPEPENHTHKYEVLKASQSLRGNKALLRVADYTTSPGPRYKADGEFSGQWFRDKYAQRCVEDAIFNHTKLVICLSGTAGYATSFLDEAFGRLPEILDLPLSIIEQWVEFICEEEPELVDEIHQYMVISSFNHFSRKKDNG